MTDTNRSTAAVKLRLTPETKRKLEALAAVNRTTVSEYVDQLIAWRWSRFGDLPMPTPAKVARALREARAASSGWRKGEGK